MSPQQAIDLGLNECRQQFPKRVRGQLAAQQRCNNEVYDRYASLNGPLNADLVRLAGLKTLEAAERYDAGKLTDTQFDLEVAQIKAEFEGGSQARASQALTAQAAQNQAAAAQSMAATQQSRAIQDAFAPKNTTCTGAGNTMTCRPSY